MSKFPWELLPGWMSRTESDEWMKKLYRNLDWEQPTVKVYGKEYLVPRKTIFIGEKNITYNYSGLIHKSNGWPSWFYPLLEKVSLSSKNRFNGCLINLYRNGNDRMGWHSDDEKELNPNKPISSLSLGADRDFLIKNRYSNDNQKISLNNGDLFIMYPPCQKEWIHSIPIRKKINSSRINLTFRSYINER